MGREVVLFSSEDRKARTEVTSFLRHLADRLDTGEVTLRQGSEEIVVTVPEHLILEVKLEDEAKRTKGVQHSLEVELKWYDNMTSHGGIELG